MSEVTTGVVRGFMRSESASSTYGEMPVSPAKKSKTDLRVKKVELVVRCQELTRFLRGFDEHNWADWIEECIAELRQHSGIGIEALLAGYSGIGSVGDVYLCPEAGHRISAKDETAINEQFLLMLAKVNNLARDIQRRDRLKKVR